MTPRSSPDGEELDTVANLGEGPGERSLFLDQTEARRPEKILFGDPSPVLSNGLDDRGPPLISRSGFGTVDRPKRTEEIEPIESVQNVA